MDSLTTTPLTDWHQDHGAKMAPFAGWNMPIQYEGILAEHKHTRTQAALFDICHMGECRITGPGARDGLDRIVTHNLERLRPGRCSYGFLLTPEGTVQDDLIVYCLDEDDFMLVVNAACQETDFTWLREHLPAGVAFEDISEATAKIDLQGPTSIAALERVLPGAWRELKFFGHCPSSFGGQSLRVSRTGYTGELGYEIYLPREQAVSLWEQFLDGEDVKPAGLGARDTLRLEAGLLLYGQDLDREHTPAEAGYAGMLTSQAPYIGKDNALTVRDKLVALQFEGRRTAHHHDTVLDASGAPVGTITSASFAPSLGHAIGLAYIQADAADQDQYTVQTKRAALTATVTSLPFYNGTARMKL
ncbi:glycine cleavage system aminomethyltransferase GcvT [Desulfohalobium retbaense]|uniref:aminomethyltransferase n=1 Tax=Desulfohalobium retbaense (strain ATCC 49708 / DSM 5692 / JCM 16813 / HR100) TaxID=485915 RepID=C8X346_DESRD|nr:glycine cleavage system aminomethyltransferase GcvT [Desulfohalobium retbaense]ACV68843.1 glycine cleavage system T protein [Desulfohalobium retbaense DSM 5692]